MKPSDLIAQDELRSLSTIGPWRSPIDIVLTWLQIALAVAICLTYWHPALYLITVIFIAGRQHALLVLMHEGAHYRLHPNRSLNDGLSRVLVAWPHLLSFAAYRRTHLAHHRHLLTEEDPDWMMQREAAEYCGPIPARRLLGFFLRDVTGLGLIGQLKTVLYINAGNQDRPTKKPTFITCGLVFYAVVAAVIIGTGTWLQFLLFWIVPLVTWLKWFLYARSLGEHYGIESDPGRPWTLSRTVLPTVLERWLICPFNVSYHVEHHLFPGVPYYKLPRLRGRLLTNPEYAHHSPTTNGYFEVFRQVGSTGVTR